jgi:hypothetical protein
VHHKEAYDAPMPAKNPRLTITLKPSLATQLKRLSELTGNSQSALIGEMLDGSVPVFERLIVVLEAAHEAKNELRDHMTENLQAGQARVEAQFGILLEDFEHMTQPVVDAAVDIKRRSAGAGGTRVAGARGATDRPISPPISNRGVRSLTNQQKSAKAQGQK